MNVALESMAVEMPEVEGHPNRVQFQGVLTVVDVPSQRAPAGSKGRRVLLTREAAQAALPSLLGMAVDYAPSYDRHDARRKVGIITHADVVGRNLEVGGYLYARDFPEIVEEVAKSGGGPAGHSRHVKHQASRLAAESSKLSSASSTVSLAVAVRELRRYVEASRRGVRLSAATPICGLQAGAVEDRRLGMSFEVTNAQILDQRARVWVLTDVTFTGAAILRRDKAAYSDTWIELVK